MIGSEKSPLGGKQQWLHSQFNLGLPITSPFLFVHRRKLILQQDKLDMVCMHLSLHSKQTMYKYIRQPQHRKGHKMTANNQSDDNVRIETTHMCFFIVCTKKIHHLPHGNPNQNAHIRDPLQICKFPNNVPMNSGVATITSCAESQPNNKKTNQYAFVL